MEVEEKEQQRKHSQNEADTEEPNKEANFTND